MGAGLMDQNTLNWLQLSLTQELSARSCRQRLTKYGDTENIIRNLRSNERNNFNKVDPLRLKEHLEWAQQPNHHILSIECPSYPQLLKELPDPPTILYANGQLKALSRPQIAIIGSRKASFNGTETATRLATELSQVGLTITSGLAIGIDAAAHQGALAAGGHTIAVLGSGIDIAYPKKNKQLYEKIKDNGLLISEFPLRTQPLRQHFPQRNRIISGLCLGVIVVEAALQSGSLITCRLALEQNREVFAVPGYIGQPQSAGCHSLIQQGAKLITKYQDITDDIQFHQTPLPATAAVKPITNKLDQEHQHLLECVNFSATGIGMIQGRSNLSSAKMCSMLAFLELQGYLKQIPSHGYARIK
jgi:DNA processing protein